MGFEVFDQYMHISDIRQNERAEQSARWGTLYKAGNIAYLIAITHSSKPFRLPVYSYEKISKSIHRITELKKKIRANQTETSQSHLSKQKITIPRKWIHSNSIPFHFNLQASDE